MADGEVLNESSLRAQEREILEEARRWGLGRDLGASATDMHLFAMLQHHGVPTRLIDVTANPMTALWFAIEPHAPDESGEVRESPGVLFAIDVTDTDWYETFQHAGAQTWGQIENPLGATYREALAASAKSRRMFRAFPALPDERMKAQEGFFVGSAVPKRHRAPGVLGINPLERTPGGERLRRLAQTADDPGGPEQVPLCAIIIPASVKDGLRDPLKRTYNRRRRVLFPDVDGFREALIRRQLD